MAEESNLARKLSNLSTPVRVERAANGTILVKRQPGFTLDDQEGYLYLPDTPAPSNSLYLQPKEYELCTKPNPVYARLKSWFFEDIGSKKSMPITQVTILPYDDFLKTMINIPDFGEGKERVTRMPFSQIILYSNRDYLVKKLREASLPKEKDKDSGSHLMWLNQSDTPNGKSSSNPNPPSDNYGSGDFNGR